MKELKARSQFLNIQQLKKTYNKAKRKKNKDYYNLSQEHD